MIDSSDDFIVDFMCAKDRWSVVAMAAVMTTGSVVVAIWAGIAGLIVGLLGGVFFGLMCLPYLFFRAIRPGHALIVSADGLTLNTAAIDLGHVGWGEVESIETASLGPHSWVVIKLHDPEAFLRRHWLLRRALLRLNGPRLKTCRIAASSLPLPASEVAEIMESKRRSAARAERPLATSSR